MKAMKRSWVTYIAVAGLVGLIGLFAVLQYHGLRQISSSEGEKAHKRVQEQADRFAADFNREIQNAYFNFQTDAASWDRNDWGPFNERYDYWSEKTNYKDLIADVYYFSSDGQKVLRYVRDQRAFLPAAGDDAGIKAIGDRLSDPKNFRPVYPDIYLLALPIHRIGTPMQKIVITSSPARTVPDMNMPDRAGVLAIKLDESVVKGRLLPDLTAKYFGDGEFRAAVVAGSGEPIYKSLTGENSDAKAGLFDMSADNFIQYANKDLITSIGNQRQGGLVVASRVESHLTKGVPLPGSSPETFQIEVKRSGPPGTAVFTRTSSGGNEPTWSLQVQHSTGSLDGYIESTFRRNLAIGFGLLLLLAGAVAAIIFSAYRSRLVAQRQLDFVSSVSHEFRTPLAVIYSAGENLADGVAKEDQQVSRYGELIKGEGKKLSGMVEQILEFAGANSGRKKYNFARAAVGDVVAEVLANCDPMLKEKGFVVESEVAETLPEIEVDRSALSGAIQNLIVNSVKYCNGEKWIKVSAHNGNGRVKISVEDHGIGIAKKEIKQIFEPFYRSKAVVDAQIHGNGLGLALVRQIAVAHGGTVTAESEVEKGSKFTIELPCQTEKN